MNVEIDSAATGDSDMVAWVQMRIGKGEVRPCRDLRTRRPLPCEHIERIVDL